jgi:hypothetical protein
LILKKLAKKRYYNKLILKSKNKIKTSWSIIRSLTNTNLSKNTIPLINIEGKLCNNVQIMANFISNYFTTLLPHMQFGTPSNVQAVLNYLLTVFKNPFPNINMMPVANKEIKDIANYRPISLLTYFSNIFEKVIFNRLQHHLDIYNILAQEQYGFQTKLPTDLATFDLINNILLALNNKLAVGGTIL